MDNIIIYNTKLTHIKNDKTRTCILHSKLEYVNKYDSYIHVCTWTRNEQLLHVRTLVTYLFLLMWDRNIFHGMSSKIRIFMSGAATSENALFWSSRVKYVSMIHW